ncbi:MAG: tripartite tricarboxylate transporter permease [Streptosporangiales bacterium]|nr:tripartite tricarboxylate transporter permease [Streptosporangiales bacterium]
MYAFLGVFVGTLVGVLPGIGPALTVALLLPMTYTLDASASLIMFAGIYYGAMYGGSTTSILLNTPGESGSIITAIDGNKMARAGRGAAALATAAIGSFVAGTIATTVLAFAAPTVAALAVKLGPADYFALMILAFITVGSLLGSSMVRGFASMGVGLLIGLVGVEQVSGQTRFTLGLPQLNDGIEIVVVIVGLFAIGEVLYTATRKGGRVRITPIRGRAWMTRDEFRRSWKPWLRGTAIGFPFGAVPAGGSEIPTFISYTLERRLSKRKEEFGKGAIEGVAGPEAANNANAAGVLVPLLTLGIPTSATAAVILVAFQQYGLQPGPQLLDTEPDLVWSLIASLFIGNLLLLVLNLPLVGMWVRLLHIPQPYLYAGILTFALLGAYTVNNATFDIFLMLIVGALGMAMRWFGWPLAPLVIGAILGPNAEVYLRRALQISTGDPTVLVESPFSITVYVIVILLLGVPFLLHRWEKRTAAAITAASGSPEDESPAVAQKSE